MNTYIGNILNHQFRRSQVICVICAMGLLLISFYAFQAEAEEAAQKPGAPSKDRIVSEKLITHIDLSSWIPKSFKVSPDTKRVAYMAKVGNKQFVVVDGKEEKQYDAVGEGTLTFSPDSRRVAYKAGVGNKQFVVVDGKEEKQYDSIGMTLIFSPDSKRVAYGAMASNKWFVVVDGKEEKQYDGIGKSTIIFSPDSKRVAYEGNNVVGTTLAVSTSLAGKGKHDAFRKIPVDKWFAVVDGIEGKQYNSISSLVFSPDSRRVACGAMASNKWFVVVDGKEEKQYDSIGMTLIFSPDSNRVAYVAKGGNKQFVVVDGKEEKEYDGIGQGTIIFSPDSKRMAYMAKVVDKWFVVVDGIEEKQYDRGGGLTFSPDSRRVAYGAMASNKWFVVVDGKEEKQYDGIIGSDRGRIDFDSNNRVHYLAIKGKEIFLVEERIE